jgi:hypothetical protein
MKNRFVSAVKPAEYADRLHEIQQVLSVKKAELAALEEEKDALCRYLLRVSKGKSFEYDGVKYRKIVKIRHNSRMILDQAKVLKLLRNKTPYVKSTWNTISVDFVYEE